MDNYQPPVWCLNYLSCTGDQIIPFKSSVSTSICLTRLQSSNYVQGHVQGQVQGHVQGQVHDYVQDLVEGHVRGYVCGDVHGNTK